MSNVSVPDIKISVVVGGCEVARFNFHKVSLHPQDWEIVAALRDLDTKQAVRSCLLAAIAELSADGWESYSFDAEGGGETNDQPQLPWE